MQQFQGRRRGGQRDPQGGEDQRDPGTARGGGLQPRGPLETEPVDGEQARLASGGPTVEFRPLLTEDLVGQAAVRQGVGNRVPDQLVVLHQPVIGVLRKGERGQEEGVHHLAPQQVQGRLAGAQGVQVVPQQVVSEDEVRVGGEAVEFGERHPFVEPALAQEGLTPTADRPDLVDGPSGAGLQVEQEGMGEKGAEPGIHDTIMEEIGRDRIGSP